MTENDKLDVSHAISSLLTQAGHYFQREFPTPAVSFRKSGKHAGTAFLQQNRVNFHPVLFTHNKAEYFSDVIPHELSHLLVYQLYGKVKPHGREWQSMMRQVFECEPKTTHNFDLTPLAQNTFSYYCQCGDVQLSTRRHNKVMRGQQQYQCRKCKQLLTPADVKC